MNQRERTLGIVIVGLLGGLALWSWGIKPVFAEFDRLDKQADTLEQDLKIARNLVNNEAKYRTQWLGYERAGLSHTLEEADALTSGSLLSWAEDAGLDKVNLTDGDDRLQRDKPYGELVYTLQTAGQLREISDLLWSIRHSPFPLRIEKCVLDQRNPEAEQMQMVLTVSTLFKVQADTDGGKR